MNPQKRSEIFSRFKEANPQPATELAYSTPFELLIAVILSAQATDRSVNLATRRLFKVANTPKKILGLGEAGLMDYIKSIGLFRTKTKNLLSLSQKLLDDYQGNVPSTREQLEGLPGVGRKTANVVLNSAFGEPVIAVDTHIFRVANRTRLAPGKTPREVEDKLMKSTPETYRKDAHHWLILHGRYVCVARKPKCPECLIDDLCEYLAKTRIED
ncbi:MAG: endonuclease III [Burkholderiales bacterium]